MGENASLRAERDRLKEEVVQLQEDAGNYKYHISFENASLRAERDRLEEEVVQLQEDVGNYKYHNNFVTSELLAAEKKVDELRVQLAEAQAALPSAATFPPREQLEEVHEQLKQDAASLAEGEQHPILQTALEGFELLLRLEAAAAAAGAASQQGGAPARLPPLPRVELAPQLEEAPELEEEPELEEQVEAAPAPSAASGLASDTAAPAPVEAPAGAPPAGASAGGGAVGDAIDFSAPVIVRGTNALLFKRLLRILSNCAPSLNNKHVPAYVMALRLLWQAAAYLRSCTNGSPAKGSVVFVRAAGLLPPSLQASDAPHAPIFWIDMRTRGIGSLLAGLHGYDAVFAAGAGAEMQCGNRLVEMLPALLQAAGGKNGAKDHTTQLQEAAHARRAGYLDQPANADLKAALSALKLATAAGPAPVVQPPASAPLEGSLPHSSAFVDVVL
eukprot:scaffold5.g662.t1